VVGRARGVVRAVRRIGLAFSFGAVALLSASPASAWQVVDPLLSYWEDNSPDQMPTYAAGTWGPASANELIERDGREWRSH